MNAQAATTNNTQTAKTKDHSSKNHNQQLRSQKYLEISVNVTGSIYNHLDFNPDPHFSLYISYHIKN